MNIPPLPDSEKIETLRVGQRLLCVAILFYIIIMAVVFIQDGNVSVAVTLAYPVTVIMAFIGVYRVTKGLDYSIPRRIINGLLPIVPILGLIALLMVNSKATKALRAHGYKVGIMGAPMKERG